MHPEIQAFKQLFLLKLVEMQKNSEIITRHISRGVSLNTYNINEVTKCVKQMLLALQEIEKKGISIKLQDDDMLLLLGINKRIQQFNNTFSLLINEAVKKNLVIKSQDSIIINDSIIQIQGLLTSMVDAATQDQQDQQRKPGFVGRIEDIRRAWHEEPPSSSSHNRYTEKNGNSVVDGNKESRMKLKLKQAQAAEIEQAAKDKAEKEIILSLEIQKNKIKTIQDQYILSIPELMKQYVTSYLEDSDNQKALVQAAQNGNFSEIKEKLREEFALTVIKDITTLLRNSPDLKQPDLKQDEVIDAIFRKRLYDAIKQHLDSALQPHFDKVIAEIEERKKPVIPAQKQLEEVEEAKALPLGLNEAYENYGFTFHRTENTSRKYVLSNIKEKEIYLLPTIDGNNTIFVICILNPSEQDPNEKFLRYWDTIDIPFFHISTGSELAEADENGSYYSINLPSSQNKLIELIIRKIEREKSDEFKYLIKLIKNIKEQYMKGWLYKIAGPVVNEYESDADKYHQDQYLKEHLDTYIQNGGDLHRLGRRN